MILLKRERKKDLTGRGKGIRGERVKQNFWVKEEAGDGGGRAKVEAVAQDKQWRWYEYSRSRIFEF